MQLPVRACFKSVNYWTPGRGDLDSSAVTVRRFLAPCRALHEEDWGRDFKAMDVLCSVLNAVASWISPYYRGFTTLSKLTLIVILYLLALFLLNFKIYISYLQTLQWDNLQLTWLRGAHVNRSEIWSNIKGELLGSKWVGNRLPDSSPPQKRAPGWKRTVWYPSD